MRIYLAAPWIARDEARQIGRQIEQEGHVITHPWWDHEGKGWDAPRKELAQQAVMDYQGVKSADCVIVLNSSKSEGKATEQGIAIATGLPIILIEYPGVEVLNIFHNLSNYTRVQSFEAALEELGNVTAHGR